MVQNHLLPILSFADVQRLGQTCQALQTLVSQLSDTMLRDMAHVRPAQCCMQPFTHVWHRSDTIVQAQRLPAGQSGSMRQQLHSWAKHAAAVQGGSLHMARDFENCPAAPESIAFSPELGYVAAVQLPQEEVDGFNAGLIDIRLKVAPLPAAGPRVDIQKLLMTKGQKLPAPSASRGSFRSVRCDVPSALKAAHVLPFAT